ncbi:MAG TPA: hypothetical protein VGC30_14070, partial [Dokdonella sp.]
MRSRLTLLLMACGIAVLAGCASQASKDSAREESGDILTAETIMKPSAPLKADDAVSGIAVTPDVKANRPAPKPEIEIG